MNEDYLNLGKLLYVIDVLKDEHSNNDAFNAYEIFRLNEKEVMHSRFIKSLLNPDENHGFKDDFLKMFLKRVGIEGFETDYATVECEKNTHNNRYIDIAVENKMSKQMIIIENKINAKDSDNQLVDYYEFGLHVCVKSENIYMLYLTPNGKNPDAISFPEDKDQPINKIKCISYEKHILGWLDDCLKHINNKNTRLSLCIVMYIELIRKTINRNKYMEDIFEQLINNPTKMSLAIDVVNALKGRQFLTLKSDSRNIIISRLEEIIEDKPVNEGDEDVFYLENNINITVASDCIYGENKGLKTQNGYLNTANTALEIAGHDLNNQYLLALLTNNTELIHEWLKLTKEHVNAGTENLSE